MTLEISPEELIRLLKLKEAIFKGVEISWDLARQIENPNMFAIETLPDRTCFLWTKENWKAHSSTIFETKKREEKERRFWNLVKEVGEDIERGIIKATKMKPEVAHAFMLTIIEKKSIKHLSVFLKLDPDKYKELLENEN